MRRGGGGIRCTPIFKRFLIQVKSFWMFLAGSILYRLLLFQIFFGQKRFLAILNEITTVERIDLKGETKAWRTLQLKRLNWLQ